MTDTAPADVPALIVARELLLLGRKRTSCTCRETSQKGGKRTFCLHPISDFDPKATSAHSPSRRNHGNDNVKSSILIGSKAALRCQARQLTQKSPSPRA
jgi:hypothetical protein